MSSSKDPRDLLTTSFLIHPSLHWWRIAIYHQRNRILPDNHWMRTIQNCLRYRNLIQSSTSWIPFPLFVSDAVRLTFRIDSTSFGVFYPTLLQREMIEFFNRRTLVRMKKEGEGREKSYWTLWRNVKVTAYACRHDGVLCHPHLHKSCRLFIQHALYSERRSYMRERVERRGQEVTSAKHNDHRPSHAPIENGALLGDQHFNHSCANQTAEKEDFNNSQWFSKIKHSYLTKR